MFTSFSKSSGLLSGQVGAESLLCSAWSAQLMTAWGYYTVRVSSLHLHAATAAFPVDVGTLSHRHLIAIRWIHRLTLIPSIKESWRSTSLLSLYSTYLLPLLNRQLINDSDFVAPKRLSTIKYSSEFPNLPPMEPQPFILICDEDKKSRADNELELFCKVIWWLLFFCVARRDNYLNSNRTLKMNLRNTVHITLNVINGIHAGRFECLALLWGFSRM